MTARALSSDTAAPKHSILLDNWRGWAILFVVTGHFIGLPGVDFGRLGVELFFVLSGRLMADLLFAKRTPLPTFFYRRFTRVLPLSLLYVLTVWLAFPPGHLYLPGKVALVSAGMVVNYTQLIGLSAPVTDHFWSLCVEEHSYLALAMIASLLRRYQIGGVRTAQLCLTLAALMALNGARLWLANHNYYQTYWRSDVRAASIFVSVGLRVLYLEGKLGWAARPWVPLSAFLIGLFLNWHHVPEPLKYSLGTLAIAFSINSLEHTFAIGGKLLSSRVIGWVGVISYSLYIWQQPFYYSIERYGALPMLALSLVVAVLSFYVIENPIRSTLNARRREKAARAITPQG